MRRVMCVYLPRWPLQRLLRDQPELRDKPLVLVSAGTRGPQVRFCSRHALRAGIRPGMPVAEATALEPRLYMQEQDLLADGKAVEGLARWLERYSPLVGLEEGEAPHSLLVDVTGCGPCFGGEDRLLERASRELADDGWWARLAIADTVGAAWGLAHYGQSPALAPAGTSGKALGDLPTAALRLPDSLVQTLAALGLDRVGQLLALPREDLPSRFGPLLLERLDQAMGLLAEPVAPHRSLPEVQAHYRFEDPCERREELEQVLGEMTERIRAVLAERGWGARRLECWLYLEAAATLHFELGLCRPSGSSNHLGALLRARLEQSPPSGPVSAAWLRVTLAEPVGDRQAQLFETGTEKREELAGLIDRLSSRLGREAVTRVTLIPDPQPEHACRLEPVVAGTLPASAKKGAAPFSPEYLRVFVHRPLLLWPAPQPIEVLSVVPEGPPVRFRWEGTDYRVVHAQGPERIETGWWRGQDVQRDYYVVTTQLGTRYWIFRHRDEGQWFLHGCFD